MINGGSDRRRREGFEGRECLQVNGRKRRRGKRLDMLMDVMSSASGARHRCKESRRCEETLCYRNRRRYQTPARHGAHACSRHRFHRTSGADCICPFLLELPDPPKLGRPLAQAVTRSSLSVDYEENCRIITYILCHIHALLYNIKRWV